MACWRRLLVGTVTTGVALAFALSDDSAAHPSDFSTLTLDLLVGMDGLHTVDAAIVKSEGPDYEPFPSGDEKQSVAIDVLEVLGFTNMTTEINAVMGDQYHEVGFTIHFSPPTYGVSSTILSLDTEGLQRIAGEVGLQRLKLSICPLPDSGGSLPAMEIESTEPGRLPNADSTDRPGCTIWSLAPLDRPISISVVPTTTTLAHTGRREGMAAVVGLIVFAVGLLLITASRRMEAAARSQARRAS